MDAQQTKSPSLVTDLQINLRIYQHAFKFLPDTVSVKMVGTLWGLLVPSMLVYKIW